MPKSNAFSNSACPASSFSMEQNRVPEPKPMQETISPVLPRRRFGRELAAPHDCSDAPSTTAAVVVFRNSRRDQRVFIAAPFCSQQRIYHGHQYPEHDGNVNTFLTRHHFSSGAARLGPST